MKRHVYVIAGPNGAGKTTFAREFLPRFAKCDEFVNADMIATGLSPFDPGAVAIQAGKMVLLRIRELMGQGIDFGFETTLSGRSYVGLLNKLRMRGYLIHLFFLWLPKVELAIDRVRDRVKQGGHDVHEPDIRRRYRRGLKNFFTLYQPLLQDWALYDNSSSEPKVIAFGEMEKIKIIDPMGYQKVELLIRSLND